MAQHDSALDPLLCLRAAVRAGGDDVLKHVSWRDASGAAVSDVESAVSVAFQNMDAATLQPAEGAALLSFPVTTPIRILRTRDSLTQEGGAPKLDTNPDAFLPLSAAVFALQHRDDRAGAYLRAATMAEVVPLPALERPAVIEYLLGKRDAWEGVVPALSEETHAAPAPSMEGRAQAAESADASQEAGAPAPTTAPPKRVYTVDTKDAEFVRRLRSKYEVVLEDRNSALQGMYHPDADDAKAATALGVVRTNSDLLGLRAMLAPRLEAAKQRLHPQNRSSHSSSSVRAAPSAVKPARKSRAQDPIILLSNSPTALVNMFNVKALLQDGVFVPPDVAREQAGGVAELVVTLRPPASEGPASGPTTALTRRILVVDSAEAVNRLGSGAPGTDQDPWNRVVAVFTTGQTWQFKAYRWTDPRDLFRHGTLVTIDSSHGRVRALDQRRTCVASEGLECDATSGTFARLMAGGSHKAPHRQAACGFFLALLRPLGPAPKSARGLNSGRDCQACNINPYHPTLRECGAQVECHVA